MERSWNGWRTIAVAAAVGVLGAGAAEAADCTKYTARRLAHFETLAQRAITQCVRRDADACPDARLTKQLDASAARIARSVVRRCPAAPITNAIATARARALCDLLAVCGSPRTITVSVGQGAAAPVRRVASALHDASAPSERRLVADAGWTGLAHDLAILEGASFTAALADCDDETDTLCALHGATAGTPFGAPSPLGAGGVSFCVDIGFRSDIEGAYDLASGALTYDATVGIEVYLGRSIDEPCAACVPADQDPQLGEAGTCVGSVNAGAACVVEGLGDAAFGADRGTSRTCAPNPATRVAVFETEASATTGAFAMGPLPDGPLCNAFGFAGQICPCSTCDDAGARACRSDAECVRPDGTSGVCGGRRCINGANAGLPCSTSTQCGDGGFCGAPGAIVARNSCLDQTCTPSGDGGGVCLEGPIDSVCAIARHRGCISNADCPAGDHCTEDLRRCHPDVITLEGSPAPVVGGVSEPTLVGGFCMAPAAVMAVNYVAGFPGPVTYVWPTEVRLGQ